MYETGIERKERRIKEKVAITIKLKELGYLLNKNIVVEEKDNVYIDIHTLHGNILKYYKSWFLLNWNQNVSKILCNEIDLNIKKILLGE